MEDFAAVVMALLAIVSMYFLVKLHIAVYRMRKSGERDIAASAFKNGDSRPVTFAHDSMVLPSWGMWCTLTKLAKRRGFEPIVQQIPVPVQAKLKRLFRLLMVSTLLLVAAIVLMEAFDLGDP